MLVKIQTPASRRKAALPAPEPWPPMEYRLPDTIARIEVGRPEQQQLFPSSRLLPNATPKATARKRMKAPYPT